MEIMLLGSIWEKLISYNKLHWSMEPCDEWCWSILTSSIFPRLCNFVNIYYRRKVWIHACLSQAHVQPGRNMAFEKVTLTLRPGCSIRINTGLGKVRASQKYMSTLRCRGEFLNSNSGFSSVQFSFLKISSFQITTRLWLNADKKEWKRLGAVFPFNTRLTRCVRSPGNKAPRPLPCSVKCD